MITAKNLTIQYIKEYATIFDVNFSIDSNTLILGNHDEIVALFRSMCKIDNHYSGSILIDNNDIKTIADKDLSIAYVPKEPCLFRHKSVKNNLVYPLKIRKTTKIEIQKRLNYIYENFISNFPLKTSKLTASQRKIITMLRAYIWAPKYIILEHFFDDLEKVYVKLANKIIKDISKNTIIIASENNENEIYSNFKIIEIENGSIKNGT